MPDGKVIEVRTEKLQDGGLVATFTDITKRCEAESYIAKLASEDSLTDLPNRRAFRSKLEEIRETARGVRAEIVRRAVPRSRSVQGRQ